MKHLAIGPGGLGYFAYLGAVNKLWDEGELKDLESISGASAGALVACMIAFNNFDFKKIIRDSLKVPLSGLKPNIKTLLGSYGLIPTSQLKSMIVGTIDDITFEELYKRFPIKIYLSAYCVQLAKMHYFSVDTHPGMLVSDALCMSVSVPFLFSSVKYGDWNYVDGGTTESSPCGHLVNKDSILIICLKFDSIFKINGFTDYLKKIFVGYLQMRKRYPWPTIRIELGNTDVMDFEMSEKSKLGLYITGYHISYHKDPRVY